MGKGVVSKVLPDDQMPVVIDETGERKTVEVVMNPLT
jgi:DNA-directed RNA polymerase beta subunit